MQIDIRRALKYHKIEIKGLAAKMGISPVTAHYFMRQGNKNSLETLKRFSEHSGIPIEDFFVGISNIPAKKITDFVDCPHCAQKVEVNISVIVR